MTRPYETDDEVETLAEACLNYLVANPEELARFMNHAGYDGDALRRSLGSRAMSVGLLDYFAQNESVLLAMSANSGVSADRLMRTWRRLNPDS